MQHFFINQEISGDHLVITDDELMYQLRVVLRSRVGDEYVFLDGMGVKARGMIESIDKKAIIVKLSDVEKCTDGSARLNLYIALSKKPATLELIAQKATEIGVTDIIPLVTDRCQVQNLHNEKRLLAIIKEAAEQCERCFLPKLHGVMKLATFVGDLPEGKILVGEARADTLELASIKIGKKENVNLVIGPEGGFSEKELAVLGETRAEFFVMGKNILRMETAVICALGLVKFRS